MIRKAKLDDADKIHYLIEGAAKESKVLPREIAEIEKVIGSFFVEEHDESVCGCASLEIYSPRIAEIRSLVVSPSYRNMGIGKSLIRACIEEARKKEIYEVITVTDRPEIFSSEGMSLCLGGQYAMFIKLKKDAPSIKRRILRGRYG